LILKKFIQFLDNILPDFDIHGRAQLSRLFISLPQLELIDNAHSCILGVNSHFVNLSKIIGQLSPLTLCRISECSKSNCQWIVHRDELFDKHKLVFKLVWMNLVTSLGHGFQVVSRSYRALFYSFLKILS